MSFSIKQSTKIPIIDSVIDNSKPVLSPLSSNIFSSLESHQFQSQTPQQSTPRMGSLRGMAIRSTRSMRDSDLR